jgi:nicotinate-nucleotide adenylyltransferase
MLQAATAGESIFEVDPCELHRPGPSFTVDTLLDFRARLPAGSALFYLIGEDNAATLHTWHRAAELPSLATFVVFRRSEPHDGTAADFPTLTRRVDISATELRNRVAAGRSIRYFVPQAVAALIEQVRLYRLSDLTPPQETPLSPLNS